MGFAGRGSPGPGGRPARCRALVADNEHSEDLFTAALAQHEKIDSPYEHARTHLGYGMWLRRRRRPIEARTQLRHAVMGFDQCGADVWTGQADAELRAAGEAPTAAPSPGSSTGPLTPLTPQQQRIAHSVAQGATNREVARQLSISTRTVEYHLRNIFIHLGVRSRVALARRLEHDLPLSPPGEHPPERHRRCPDRSDVSAVEGSTCSSDSEEVELLRGGCSGGRGVGDDPEV